MGIKEYHKAVETFREALAIEPDNADSKEGLRLTMSKINAGMYGGDGKGGKGEPDERARRAMEDPEIQQILKDPMVNAALADLQRDQASATKVMKDPYMGPKIEKLIASGILRMG